MKQNTEDTAKPGRRIRLIWVQSLVLPCLLLLDATIPAGKSLPDGGGDKWTAIRP